ncbi:uncharacterized [Tachysurus ichikawai]
MGVRAAGRCRIPSGLKREPQLLLSSGNTAKVCHGEQTTGNRNAFSTDASIFDGSIATTASCQPFTFCCSDTDVRLMFFPTESFL